LEETDHSHDIENSRCGCWQCTSTPGAEDVNASRRRERILVFVLARGSSAVSFFAETGKEKKTEKIKQHAYTYSFLFLSSPRGFAFFPFSSDVSEEIG
jgi:hypothetical protein